MTVAVIDIGTNTVLLLIAKVDSSGRIETLVYEQRAPRLGAGVDASRNLHVSSIERVVSVLLEYRAIISAYNPLKTIVCATSAVRDAGNKSEFLNTLQERANVEVEILSGGDEALWTYRGALSGVPSSDKATVIDIGGGSTEIAVGDRQNIRAKMSLDIGAVRLTERVFKHNPPTHPELEKAIEIVENELARVAHFPFRDTTLVGVAGTATSLAILDQGLNHFSREAIAGYHLKLDNVYSLFRLLRAMPSDQILSLSTALAGRSDIIAAGALILREIMAHLKFKELIVSERGVRYGLVIREWERSGSATTVSAS